MWAFAFPGFFQADHQNTIAGIATGNLSEWHSLLWGFISYPFLYLSPTYGIYGLFQILIFVVSILFSILKLESLELIHSWGAILLSLVFALNPTFLLYNELYSSDIVFSILLVPLTVMLVEIVHTNGESLKSVAFNLGFGILLYIVCELRKNALLILIFAFILLLIAYKNLWKKILILFVSCGLLVIGTNIFFSKILNAEPSPSQEMASVPSMQIARVFYEDREVPDYLSEYFSEIREPESWKAGYLGFNADPEKQGVILNLEFIRNWVNLGRENPGPYVRAYLALMNPLWQLTSDAPSYITVDFSNHDNYARTACQKGKCSTDFLNQFNGEVSERQNIIANSVEWIFGAQIPVVTDLFRLIFFGRSLPFWFLFLGFVFMIRSRKLKHFFIVTIPMWSVLLSLLAFAPATQFRYSVQMFYMIPVLTVFILAVAKKRTAFKDNSKSM